MTAAMLTKRNYDTVQGQLSRALKKQRSGREVSATYIATLRLQLALAEEAHSRATGRIR